MPIFVVSSGSNSLRTNLIYFICFAANDAIIERVSRVLNLCTGIHGYFKTEKYYARQDRDKDDLTKTLFAKN